MEFKDKLKQVRLSRGLSRKQLAELCGLSHRTIQSYELGKREPDLGILINLADLLEINLIEILECIPRFNRLLERLKEN